MPGLNPVTLTKEMKKFLPGDLEAMETIEGITIYSGQYGSCVAFVDEDCVAALPDYAVPVELTKCVFDYLFDKLTELKREEKHGRKESLYIVRDTSECGPCDTLNYNLSDGRYRLDSAENWPNAGLLTHLTITELATGLKTGVIAPENVSIERVN